MRRLFHVSERSLRIGIGLATLLFLLASIVLAVKIRVGGPPGATYQINAEFNAAGQGLLSGSDVKVRGIDIGRVKSVQLHEGRALVRMDIDNGQKVPVESKATIRPKTLFGEKFVDIETGAAQERNGPFLRDEGVITHTVGGFELERVLTDLYPILKAVRPEDLSAILATLARAGEGEGARVNRQIVNFAQLARTQARHDADTQQFLDSLADLSDALATSAPDLVDAARALDQVLPDLNARGDQLGALLDSASRLSADLADVLEADRPSIGTIITEGGKTLQVLYDHTRQLGPLISGLRKYFEVLAAVGRIPYGDGTKQAAIKLVLNNECGVHGRVGCGTSLYPDGSVRPSPGTASAPSAGPSPAAPAPVPTPPQPNAAPVPAPPLVAVPTTGVGAVIDLVRQVTG